jgi:hypothetical protein
MAGLGTLLRYARLSRRRSLALKRSGMEKGAELCVFALLLWAYCRQLKLMVSGPLSSRWTAAEWMIAALAVLWTLMPVSVSPSIPVQGLSVYPLSGVKRAVYRLLSHWLDPKIAWLFGASAVNLVAVAWTAQPWLHVAQVLCVLVLACCTGTALALGGSAVEDRGASSSRSSRARRPRRFPLLWKELAYFARTLDPWMALLLAIAAGYTEVVGSWMTPAKATLPLLLISIVQLPAVLNPFALDSDSERDRYRLMPVAFASVVARKHAAVAALFLLSALPLMAALLFRISWRESFLAVAQLGLILESFLLSGLVLMDTPSARSIRMHFGGMAGDGLTIGTLAVAVTINAFFPIPVAFALRRNGFGPKAAIEFGALLAVGLYYLWLLRRQRWSPHL